MSSGKTRRLKTKFIMRYLSLITLYYIRFILVSRYIIYTDVGLK